MHDEIDDPRLARYVMGRCSRAELVEVRAILRADPELAALVEEMQRLWALVGSEPAWDVDRGWRELLETRAARGLAPPRTETSDTPARGLPVHRSSRWGLPALRARPEPPWHRWASVSAAAFLFAAATMALWYTHDRAPRAAVAASAPMNEIATRRGQRAILRLTDGTRVLLGVDSRIRYAPSFGSTNRDLYLDGEAYFEVVHQDTTPFLVHTALAVTKDLGTKFMIRSYADDSAEQVVVAEGKVVVHNARRDSSVLERGDLARFGPTGVPRTHHGVDVAQYLSWTHGRLVFTNAPLHVVVPRLERWYDVDIRLSDSTLANRRLAAAFENEPIGQVMQRVALALDLRVQIDGRTILLSPRARHRHES
jgi:ferric-dicitrate binding protein FerR (iron transport regulator)